MHSLPQTFNGKSFIYAWEYTANGKVIGYVVRYENNDSEKEIIPFFKWDGHTWKPGVLPEPRPLYGADNLNRERAVLVVEGEKTAKALHYMGLQAVTSLGGCNAADKSDWSPLADCKKIYLLPDNDEAGQAYMRRVAGILCRSDLVIVELPSLPEKGDAVDWIQSRINFDGYNDDPAIKALWSDFKDAIGNNSKPIPNEWMAKSEHMFDEITPMPLSAKIEPDPYPLDALPSTILYAVEEALSFTKAPIPLVASSALAALSLAGQAHVDVKRAEKLTGPVGLFFLTIADSGERKSTCDDFFMQAIRDYEVDQIEIAKPAIKDYKTAFGVWEAKHRGIKDKIRSLAKSGKPTHEQESAMRDLEHDKPEPPRVPRLIYADATPEALKWELAKSWPSGGLVSSEAGLVFGAHGMGKESVMRNLATLNQLWDGADIVTDRRTSESFTVRGARLTMALQVQEVTLRSFFGRSDGLPRGTGFLARNLVAWPESTQGYRPFVDPPDSWPALEKFNKRITSILDQDVPINEDGALSPLMLSLTPAAKAAWVTFHDFIESKLRSGGELYDVRDVASKTADNAARMAALFHVFEHGNSGAISLEEFESASRITAWHLHEARRFYGELLLPQELADAARLDQWLIDYCRKEKTNIVSRRKIQRYITPTHLRQKTALENALAELVETDRVRLVQDGKRKEVYIHPKLLKGVR